MKVLTAELMGQAHTPSQVLSLPNPQVAVFGRSNVGKSSLLAALMNRRRLVKVSSTPGKTRAIFYYLVNGSLVLVDLPGYGFSRAPRAVAAGWRALVEAYLGGPSPPSLALHLVDVRHPPTRDDRDVHALLAERGIPSLVVATKADKVSRSARLRSSALIARDLGEPVARVVPASTREPDLPASALWDRILKELPASARPASRP